MNTFCRVYLFVSFGRKISEVICLDIKNTHRKLIVIFNQKFYLIFQKPPRRKATKYFVQ